MERTHVVSSPRGPGALARRLALGLGLALIAGGFAVPAAASDGVKTFTASVSPAGGQAAPVCAGESTTFTVTLTNTSSQQQLGSVNITPGFDVVVEGARTATIELRDLGLLPGRTLTVPFTGTPGVGDYALDIVGKQANNFRGNPGNNLTLVGATPGVTVSDCAPELFLRFTTQPGASEVGKAVTGPPEVQIVDGEGEVFQKTGVEITVALEGGAEGGVFAQTSTTTVATGTDGSATFDNLRIDGTGLGYRLEATAVLVVSAATSDAFDVFDVLCPVGSCSLTAGGLRNQGDLQASASGTAVVRGAGLSVGVEARPENDAGCTVPPGVSLSRLPKQVTVIANGLEGKTVEIRVDRSVDQQQTNNGVSFYQICAEPIAPSSGFSSFRDRYDHRDVNIGGTGSAQPTGWLPDCSATGDTPPCVVSRVKRGGDPVITVRWGSGFRFR